MRILIAGVASLAMMGSIAVAQPNNGKGDKGNGNAAAKADRGNGKTKQRGNGQAKQNAGAQKRGNTGNSSNKAQSNRSDKRAVRVDYDQSDQRGKSNKRGDTGIIRDIDRVVDRVAGARFIPVRGNTGYYEGCPPGLAKKQNGCQAPGQARKNGNVNRFYDRPALFGLSALGSDNFVYDDGFLLRLGDGGGVSGYVPLLGGALAIGNEWPSYYQSRDVPDYYQSYYGLEPSGYRYADNVIYRVDAKSASIQSVAALLTGDDFVVGQRVPRGYSAYNVPYQYRDQYRDRPGANYRYADGYVYEIDPETQLIAAAIDLVI